jgi:mRNA interferase RelE/StbE
MLYKIVIEKTARKDIEKIDKVERIPIIQAISELANDPRPHGCKKLKGRTAWRIRVGNYRVIYEIEDDLLVVIVITAGHRKDVYKA